MKFLWFYLFIVNVVTFFTFAWDKHCAKKHRRRVPEATLLCLSAIGGALGGFLSMQLFRHKTKHKRFSILMPLMLLVQACLMMRLI